jgi:hypothetical protein
MTPIQKVAEVKATPVAVLWANVFVHDGPGAVGGNRYAALISMIIIVVQIRFVAFVIVVHLKIWYMRAVGRLGVGNG